MQYFRRFWNGSLLIFTLFFLASCGKNSGKQSERDTSMMPSAKGKPSEIMIVTDTTDWQNEVGTALRRTFMASMPGLPQSESYFKVNHVLPSKFNNVLQQARNLVFVITLDNDNQEHRILQNYLTDNSIEKIQKNPKLYSFTKQDVYARGQHVLYLFGNNASQLAQNIQANKKSLQDYFLQAEWKDLQSKIKNSPESKVKEGLQKQYGVVMDIPFGYKLAFQRSNFFWLRLLDIEAEKNIWMARIPYQNENIFKPENIKKLRNELGKKYIYDVEDSSMYLTSQDEMPFVCDTVNFQGMFAVRTHGLWKYSDNSRGGAFVSYTFVQEDTQQLYYLEAYLDSPGKNKRNNMMELEAILNTFQFADKAPPKEHNDSIKLK